MPGVPRSPAPYALVAGHQSAGSSLLEAPVSGTEGSSDALRPSTAGNGAARATESTSTSPLHSETSPPPSGMANVGANVPLTTTPPLSSGSSAPASTTRSAGGTSGRIRGATCPSEVRSSRIGLVRVSDVVLTSSMKSPPTGSVASGARISSTKTSAPAGTGSGGAASGSTGRSGPTASASVPSCTAPASTSSAGGPVASGVSADAASARSTMVASGASPWSAAPPSGGC